MTEISIAPKNHQLLAPALNGAIDITTRQGRQALGLPEVMPATWLRLPPDKAGKLAEIIDIDLRPSSGIMVGKVVSPWPALSASLSAVTVEHKKLLETVAELKRAADVVSSMPNLHAETKAVLQAAQSALSKSAERITLAAERTKQAALIVAEHLIEAGWIKGPDNAEPKVDDNAPGLS